MCYTNTTNLEVCMKANLKKIFLTICAFSLVALTGCSKEEKKEDVQLISNTVYDAPTNPTDEQIGVYNELSIALNGTGTEEKVAELVAVNFAYEFYTLKNKTGKEDVGGLTFLPEVDRDEFKSYAMYKYYTNYQTVVSQYGEESLPNVILHEVNSAQATSITYNNLVYNGYIITLTLKYEASKLPQDGLKDKVAIQVVYENGVARVVAAESPNASSDGNTNGTTQNQGTTNQ